MRYSLFSKKNACRFLSFLISSILWPSSLKAKEIYLQPSISFQMEYDDNKRLKTNRFDNIDTSAFGFITRAAAKVGVRSDRYEIALNNQVIINRYISDFDLDSDDFNINLKAGYSFTERSRFGFSGSYTRNTTLSSELDSDNSDGTGLVQDNITRHKWSVSPDWSYVLSEKQTLQASYSHSEISYGESELGSFVDYNIDLGSLSINQQWTSLFSSFISVSAMYYEVPSMNGSFDLNQNGSDFDGFKGVFEGSQEITEYSATVGAEYQISQTWSANAHVGVRFTNTEATRKNFFNDGSISDVPTSSDTQGLVYSVGVNKQFETGEASLVYSRSTSAQGDGRLQVRDSFKAHYGYEFSRKLQLSLDGSIDNSSSATNGDASNDRVYYRVRPSIRWAFDRQASLTAGYQYRRQKYEGSDDAAVSNAVFLTFSYRWDKLSTQRY
jgi:hypothetical protein